MLCKPLLTGNISDISNMSHSGQIHCFETRPGKNVRKTHLYYVSISGGNQELDSTGWLLLIARTPLPPQVDVGRCWTASYFRRTDRIATDVSQGRGRHNSTVLVIKNFSLYFFNCGESFSFLESKFTFPLFENVKMKHRLHQNE